MTSLLLYFKQDSVEFWSLDQSSRLIDLNVDSHSNILPLYLYAFDAEVEFGSFAKKKNEEGDSNAFGDYWRSVATKNDSINYYGNSVEKKKLLSLFLRKIFEKLSDKLNFERIVLVFEPFISIDIKKEQMLYIAQSIKDIEIISIPFYYLFAEFNNISNPGVFKELIDFRSNYGDLYLNHVQNGSLKNSEVLAGLGIDPRLKSILNYLVKEIKDEGSYLSDEEI